MLLFTALIALVVGTALILGYVVAGVLLVVLLVALVLAMLGATLRGVTKWRQ